MNPLSQKKNRTLRVYIVGLAGSGKTTIAHRLAKDIDVPLYELDKLVWLSTGRLKPIEERNELVSQILSRDRWIVEGINTGWTDPLIINADLVIALTVPMRVALWRIFIRHVKAELRRDNDFPGWRRLLSFMKVVSRQYRGDDGPSTPQDPPFVQDSIEESLGKRTMQTLINPDYSEVAGTLRSKMDRE